MGLREALEEDYSGVFLPLGFNLPFPSCSFKDIWKEVKKAFEAQCFCLRPGQLQADRLPVFQ
jgi:hypothetical protein